MVTQRSAERKHTKLCAVSVLAGFIIAPGFNLRLAAQQRALELTPFKENEVPNSLILIKPSDPKFDTILNGYFPGLSEAPTFQNLRPYTVLVQNDADVPAVAYSIAWKLVYRDGSVKTVSNTSIAGPFGKTMTVPPVPPGGSREVGGLILTSAPPEMPLRPGGFRLVSPIFNMWPPGDLGGMEFYATGEFLFSSPYPISAVAEIEGAVYRGGTYSGPEGAKVWRAYITARFAAHDVAVYLLDLLNSSEPPKSVVSALDLEAKRGVSDDHGTKTMDMYIRARGGYASTMEILLGPHGRDKALKILGRIASEWPSPGAFTILGKRYRHLYSSAAQTGNAE